MVALIKTLQVILALSLLIFIHELGHFAWARIFGIRVEKFYLFFDIGGKHIFSFRRGDTEFGIGWLPLGGYCKIAGMIDESLDMGQMQKEPQPWEFRSHPAWHRLLVMVGGVLNNLIFAVLAFVVIAGIWGDSYVPNDGVEIYASDAAEDLGFRTGDRILMMDDWVPEDFGMLQADLARRNVRKVTVLRDGDTLEVYMDRSRVQTLLNTPFVFDIAVPFVVDSMASSNPNAASGLRHGDRVIAFSGKPVRYLQDARTVLSEYKGATVGAQFLRGTDTLSTELAVDTLGRIGAFLVMPRVEVRHYNALQSIPAGLKLTWETLGGYVRDLRLLATPSTGAYKSVGSFIAIGQVFPASWDWYQFLYVLALLSIMLSVMNILPIPGLDGGHILFTVYEMLSGRKPSERFLYVAQLIGMALLIGLMLLAFGNDIGRLIR